MQGSAVGLGSGFRVSVEHLGIDFRGSDGWVLPGASGDSNGDMEYTRSVGTSQ